MTDRRHFIGVIAGTLLAAPLAASAQQRSKVARIGFFYFASRQSALDSGRYAAFMQGMRDLGYVNGTSLVVEERYADAKVGRVPGLVEELVRLKVDVIVASGGPLYRPLQLATTSIPIVIAVIADPVADGYAKSAARPGGNITGLTVRAADLGPKQLELLVAVLPRMSRVGVLLRSESAGQPSQLVTIMSASQKVGIQVVLAQAGTAQEIEREFAMLARERAGGVITLADTFFLENARHIAVQALKNKMPSISLGRGYPDAGCLMSYGPDVLDNYRRAAGYVDKILKGANPGELPFEQPTRYFLVINLKTAKALDLTIPQSLILRADEVIR